MLVSHSLVVWSIEPEANTTPSQCQLQLHTIKKAHTNSINYGVVIRTMYSSKSTCVRGRSILMKAAAREWEAIEREFEGGEADGGGEAGEREGKG